MQFPATELVLDSNGAVYHLGLQPEQLAQRVILVGDQDRVVKISRFFDQIDSRVQHREFVTHTGTYKGKHITVLSTGIGTDNIDICMAELDALANIDLKTRTQKDKKKSTPTHAWLCHRTRSTGTGTSACCAQEITWSDKEQAQK